MASTPLGDIPGGRFFFPSVSSYASLASGGANAKLDHIGPFDHNIRVRSVYWQPTGADHAASQSASYRRLTLRNAGTAGTATAIIGSLNASATLASLGTRAFTVDTAVTVASGQILVFSQETVGAAEANGTILVAGRFALSYEII